jgi:hypothetical protein
VFVGGSSKFTQVLDSISPRLADKHLESTAFESERKTRANSKNHQESLIRHPRYEGQIHGPNEDQERKSNLYTTLATNPMATGIFTTLIGAGLTALSKFLVEKTK